MIGWRVDFCISLQVEVVDLPDARIVREASPESRSILDDILSRLESASDGATLVSTTGSILAEWGLTV